MKIIIGTDYKKIITLGLVTDTRYVMCYWPVFNSPTSLFDKGSKGIEVQGPPTPRNIIFPDDTVFLNVLINETIHGQPSKFRLSDVPTANPFYTVSKQLVNVEDTAQLITNVEVEPNIFVDVTYDKRITTQKLVDVYQDVAKPLLAKGAK